MKKLFLFSIAMLSIFASCQPEGEGPVVENPSVEKPADDPINEPILVRPAQPIELDTRGVEKVAADH